MAYWIYLQPQGESFQVFPSVNCCRYSTMERWGEGLGKAGTWGWASHVEEDSWFGKTGDTDCVCFLGRYLIHFRIKRLSFAFRC